MTQILILCCMFLILHSTSAMLKNVIGLTGRTVTLNPDFYGAFPEVKWTHNDDLLLYMKPPKEPKFVRLEDRLVMDPFTGQLTIKNLKKEDSGIYRAVIIVGNNFQEISIELAVNDPVSKPIIYDHSTEDQFNLWCLTSTPNATYKWMDEKNSIVSTQPIYTSPRPKDKITLTCFVNDTFSENRESITISSTSVSIELTGGMIAGIVVGAFCFGIFIAVIVYCSRNLLKPERIVMETLMLKKVEIFADPGCPGDS